MFVLIFWNWEFQNKHWEKGGKFEQSNWQFEDKQWKSVATHFQKVLYDMHGKLELTHDMQFIRQILTKKKVQNKSFEAGMSNDALHI